MGVQVIETLLNKTVSTGDDLWGIRWEKIPASLQCYALGDIRFGFITYNVLAGLLLRDLFPDPDVLCRYLDCTQDTAVNWFLEFVMLSLEGVEYHQGAEEAAQSREQMIRSLRFRDDRDKLCETPPPYVRLRTEILGSWPAATNGGCRFLLQCRQWLPVQMRALARAKIQWTEGRVIRLPLDIDHEYSRFGLTPKQIGVQSWTDPAPGDLRMVRPPGVKIELLKFEVSTAKIGEIGRACTVMGRCQCWSLLEWGMLNPELLRRFFIRMTEDDGFQRFYTNLYDLLRLCYLRMFDEKAPTIAGVEDSLNKAVILNLEAEKIGLEAAEAQVLIRKRRVSWLENLTKDWELKERTRWREVVPGVAKTKSRSGMKRPRSKLKMKPGKLKRMRLRALKAGCSAAAASNNLSGPAPSQPGLGLPGTGSGLGAMDDGREDVVILGGADSSAESDAEDASRPVSVSEKKESVKRMSAASRRSRRDGPRALTFEIPPEVENFEAW